MVMDGSVSFSFQGFWMLLPKELWAFFAGNVAIALSGTFPSGQPILQHHFVSLVIVAVNCSICKERRMQQKLPMPLCLAVQRCGKSSHWGHKSNLARATWNSRHF